MQLKSYPSQILTAAKRIDVAKLPWVLYVKKQLLPTYAGIYFVGTDCETTAYIGQTDCFKKRFLGHHRKNAFEQLVEEYGQEKVKIRYWKVPSMPKSELKTFLPQIEAYLISNTKTRINYTANSLPKTPSPSIRRTYYGAIYVQLNRLSDYSVGRTTNNTAGFYLSAKKLSMAENAANRRSPTFIISSGNWEDSFYHFQEVKPEWRQYSTLYFLEASFRACKVEYVGGGGIEDYNLWGDKATFPQIFLNELPGFKEFSIRYLRTGLTNCSDSNFCETLLSLTRIST